MLKKVKLEGKNIDEVLKKYLEENSLTRNDVHIIEHEAEVKLFKGKKEIIEVVTKEDIKKYIKDYVSFLSNNMGISINSEIREKDDVYNVVLISDNNNILIGKEGRTLNAIQLLLHQSLSNQLGINIRVNLDVSNYKQKKTKHLEYEIRKIMREVENSKVEAKLDPMNSYERRIVHTIVGENSNLETESYGESPNRYVVIRYKEN